MIALAILLYVLAVCTAVAFVVACGRGAKAHDRAAAYAAAEARDFAAWTEELRQDATP